jgi:hypothetical protein
MSVMVVLRVKADVGAFERYAQENSETLDRIAQEGRDAGAIHHLFSATDDEIVVIDEWPDEGSFQSFFEGQTEIPNVMAAAGAQGEPEVSFYRVIDTSDRF